MNERWIDMESWPRRETFELFKDYAQPFFELTSRVSIHSDWWQARKSTEESIFASLCFEITRAANNVPQLRQRLRPEGIVEHSIVHPSWTLLAENEALRFCTTDFTPQDRAGFLLRVGQVSQEQRISAQAKAPPRQGDAQLFVSCLPWLDFTGLRQESSGDPLDSVPRIVWGKVVGSSEQREMAVSICAHHALVDGLHVARFFEALQLGLRDDLGG